MLTKGVTRGQKVHQRKKEKPKEVIPIKQEVLEI